MDKAQLFKRLYDMSMDELGLLVDHDETIQKSLYKLDMAARYIVSKIFVNNCSAC